MNMIVFGIELYFAIMLGVSGIAKIAEPYDFAATLRRHRILPAWSVTPFSRVFPWLEVAIAGAVLTGAAAVATAALVLALFSAFLIVEVILVVTRRATDCGCYGVAYRQKVDGASILVSTILILLASVHLWLTTWVAPISQPWRILALIVLGGAGCWLLWRVKQKQYAQRKQYRSQSVTQS